MDDPTGVRISGRAVPFPQSVSLQARAFLATMTGPDGLPLNAMPQPAPDDLEGWTRSKEAVGKFMADFSSALSPSLKSTVETIEMAGVRVHLATPLRTVVVPGAPSPHQDPPQANTSPWSSGARVAVRNVVAGTSRRRKATCK